MLSIYDIKSDVTWPDGTTMGPEELAAHPVYGRMFEEPYVIETNEAGVASAFTPLAAMASNLGVEDSDPEKALAASVAKMEELELEARKKANALDEFIEGAPCMAEGIATAQQAVAELGVMTATGMESAAELGTMTATSMESVAELGGTVAALEARIAALEAAQA